MNEWFWVWSIFAVSAIWASATGGFRALMNPVFWVGLCIAGLAIWKYTGFDDLNTYRHHADDVTLAYVSALAGGSLFGTLIWVIKDGLHALAAFTVEAQVVEDDGYEDAPGMPEPICTVRFLRPAYGLPPLVERAAIRQKVDVTV